MTSAEMDRIMEPVWVGFVAAQCRLLEAREAAEDTAGRAAWLEMGDLQRVGEYLQELSRRVSVDGLHAALSLPEGGVATLKVPPSRGAAEAAAARYLAHNPKAAELLEREKGRTLQVIDFCRRPALGAVKHA